MSAQSEDVGREDWRGMLTLFLFAFCFSFLIFGFVAN